MPVDHAVGLPDHGESVHASPWPVAQQGRENVSHGCINMSTDARWFFRFSRPRDVVEIRGSEAGALRSDIDDWTISGRSGRPEAR